MISLSTVSSFPTLPPTLLALPSLPNSLYLIACHPTVFSLTSAAHVYTLLHNRFFQLLTFVMMYRTHCQRILDTVIRANFDEVRLLNTCHFLMLSHNAIKITFSSAGAELSAALLAGNARSHDGDIGCSSNSGHGGCLRYHPVQGYL